MRAWGRVIVSGVITSGLFSLGLFSSPAAPAPSAAVTDAKMNRFISQLLGKMTLEEKVGQLVQYSADMSITGASLNRGYQDEVKAGRVGSVFNAYTPEATRRLQKLAVEGSRLKIPLLFGHDVIHGHRTIFPIPLGESSSWDLKLIEAEARTSAREAAADGVHWTFAPMVDISRDPRWGRVSEGAGEDPWLGAKIAAARVHGLQGDDPAALDHLLACVKHFAAYGAPLAGREYGVVDMSRRELMENYLPPYKAAIDAGVASVMTSFNEIAGVPSTSNTWLLTDLLRKQWRFKGFVVTDYTAINELVNHGVAEDEKHAALLAFKAGVDMDMQGGLYSKYLPALVKEGKVSRKALDAAVRRVLEAKYRRGLFADPYRFSDAKRAKAELMSKANRAQARDTARRSIVLLKNSGGVLPLKRSGTLAVVGPLADDRRDMIGNWASAGDGDQAVSLLDGLKAAAGGKVKILYAKGSNISDDPSLVTGEIDKDRRSPEEMIKEAVAAAKRADVVVAALGETQGMSGEAAARTRIRVPESQQNLLRALKTAGKPIILVLSNGRPLALELENGLADAIVETWFLGTEAGSAMADVLFGDYNPSGKLTMTFPRSEGQIPIFYAEKNTGRPLDLKNKYTSKYIDSPNDPLFPFGWGLGYSAFKYSDLKLSARTMKPSGHIKVSVKVSNQGDYDGEEVVQLYIRDMVASVTRPLKQLRGFDKILLKKGESRVVSFELKIDDLRFYDKDMKWTAEPGAFKVMVGGNSANVLEAGFTLSK